MDNARKELAKDDTRLNLFWMKQVRAILCRLLQFMGEGRSATCPRSQRVVCQGRMAKSGDVFEFQPLRPVTGRAPERWVSRLPAAYAVDCSLSLLRS